MRADDVWKRMQSSFVVRSPEKLGKLLAVSAVVGALVGHATPRLPGVHSAFLPAALTSMALVVLLPDVTRWLRAGLAVVFAVLLFGYGRDLPTLLVLPALLGMVLFFFRGTASWPRAFAFIAGPVLGALWQHALMSLVQPWGPVTHALEVVLRDSVGLFIGVGLAAAHVEWVGDTVAERLSSGRAGDVWQRVQAALGRLPRGASRTRLEAHVHQVAERYLALVAETAGLAESIASVDVAHVREELETLAQRANEASDAGARAHLQQAMRVHKDTLEQVDGLSRQRERVEAKASAELARLERAALSLELAPAGGALGGVVERLEALAREEDCASP